LLPESVRKQHPKQLRTDGSESGPILPLSEIEKGYILKIYNRTEKNKSQTARLIGIGLNTLRRKLNAYGVE
jgi:DNA-binding protein Fis